MNDKDLDAEFARIVAGFDLTAEDKPSVDDDGPDAADPPSPGTSDPGPARPSASSGLGLPIAPYVPHRWQQTDKPTNPRSPSEPSESSAGEDAASGGATTGRSGMAGDAAGLRSPRVWRASVRPDPFEDDDEHFVPPTEFDLPSGENDPNFWSIVMLLTIGPALLLWSVIFDRGGSSWWPITGVVMTIVGFVMLVLRGDTERDPDDDGSRV